MDFNLRGLHLGDLVLAAPAMREGDRVAIGVAHWIEGIPAQRADYLDAWPVGISARSHVTQQWLDHTGRAPVRWRPCDHVGGGGVLLAPSVASQPRRWHLWRELAAALGDVRIVGDGADRAQWLSYLAEADAVVCPDTGTAHVADAIGVPRVIALHGNPYAFETHAPFWDRSHCVVRDSMSRITVEDVLEKIHG